MQRKLVTISLAALAVAVTVPLGAALTFESSRRNSAAQSHPVLTADAALASEWRRLPEAGGLAVTGGLLLGLAAAVKRVS
jgi:hypothetical protein